MLMFMHLLLGFRVVLVLEVVMPLIDITLSLCSHLRDSVATVSHRLCITITTYDDVWALVSIYCTDWLRRLFVWLPGQTLRLFVALCWYQGWKWRGRPHYVWFVGYKFWFFWWMGVHVSLVDTSNDFNSLNHTAMLLYAYILWSQCSHFLFNI